MGCLASVYRSVQMAWKGTGSFHPPVWPRNGAPLSSLYVLLSRVLLLQGQGYIIPPAQGQPVRVSTSASGKLSINSWAAACPCRSPIPSSFSIVAIWIVCRHCTWSEVSMFSSHCSSKWITVPQQKTKQNNNKQNLIVIPYRWICGSIVLQSWRMVFYYFSLLNLLVQFRCT